MTLVHSIAVCLVLLMLGAEPWFAFSVSGAWIVFSD